MARATPRVVQALLHDPAHAAQSIAVGTPDWYAWLQGATTFAYRGDAGRFTARKEQRGPAGGYWRAYRRQTGALRSVYLGISSDLSLERLQQVAARLDQPDTPPAPVAPAAPFAYLLKTKYSVPPARTVLVARPRLVERLQIGLACKLTLIAAPAGFGKTTAVSAWRAASSSPLPLAWVALDAADNDPIRFWSYVVAALDTLRPGVGATVLALLQSAQPPPIEAILTTLLNTISDGGAEMALMLDDYHVIESVQIHQALAFLLDHQPACLHLVIASRSDPPLPLSRLRARGELTELRAADLRFTLTEAASFLHDVMGVPVAVEAAQALEARTEGWIAGLQFAALAMRDRADHERFIAAFTGSNRFVMDYLAEEVLDRLPHQLQSFLLTTAILDRLCGSLCDALLPTPTSSQAVLEQLERTNLFLVALDDHRHWYRYHHLFADMLRTRLASSMPADDQAALHLRASRWYEQHGLFSESVQHAQHAQDVERVIGMIEQHGLTTALRGQLSTVRGWLEALPEALIRSRPQLCTLHATLLASTNQLRAAEARLDDAEQAIAADRGNDHQGSMHGQVTLLRANMAYIAGDLSRSMLLAQQALDLLPESDAIGRGAAMVSLAHAYRVTGDVTVAAERLAYEVIERTQAHGNLLALIAAITNLAGLYAQQGRLRQAAAIYQQAADACTDPLWLQVPVNGVLYAFGMANLLYEWNQLDAAEQHLAQGMAMVQAALTVTAESITQGYLTLARLRQARADPAGARATLDAFAELARQRSFATVLLARGAALRVQLGLLNGLPATSWVAASGLHTDDPALPFVREAEYLTLARAQIAMQRASPTRAVDRSLLHLLERLLAQAEAHGRNASVIEILAVQALALDCCSQPAESLAALERALQLAEPEGYLRVFVDEAGPMAVLVGQIASRQSSMAAHASRLLAAFPPTLLAGAHPQASGNPHGLANRSATAPAALAEPLSQREYEVLRLIAAGYSNQAIADTLVVALSTVKKHINNLYSKLNIQSRTQALVQARELQLL